MNFVLRKQTNSQGINRYQVVGLLRELIGPGSLVVAVVFCDLIYQVLLWAPRLSDFFILSCTHILSLGWNSFFEKLVEKRRKAEALWKT